MSCRARTSDLDLPDFNVPVLSSTPSCQPNRTCEGLTRMLEGRKGKERKGKGKVPALFTG